ncbi:MAG: hypothetical protein U0269_00970 [Polyangiales bacterium]
MSSDTARSIRLIRDKISIVHASLGWLALSVVIPLAFKTMPVADQSDAFMMAWVMVAVVASVVGPIQCAAALATDRNSGFIAFEQQRTRRSVFALVREYALNAQRFFVTAPLVTAPMFWWVTRGQTERAVHWYPFVVFAAQIVATVAAIAVASTVDRRDAPSSTTGLSVLAVAGALGAGAFALSLATRPVAPTLAPLALVAVSTIALAAGAARKLYDDEAPFFSVGIAIATQTAVVCAMVPLLVGSRVVEDGPLVLRAAFVFAWVIAALARSRATDGAQDLVRWSLDSERRALDPRDPRRAIVLSAALSAICAVALVVAPAMDTQTIGTFVLGAAIVVGGAAHSVVRRARQASRWQPVFITAAIMLVLWTIVATAIEDRSALYLSCPTLLADRSAVSTGAFVARASIVAALVAGLLLWAQRSFALATRASRAA